jgi:hypothetical protein
MKKQNEPITVSHNASVVGPTVSQQPLIDRSSDSATCACGLCLRGPTTAYYTTGAHVTGTHSLKQQQEKDTLRYRLTACSQRVTCNGTCCNAGACWSTHHDRCCAHPHPTWHMSTSACSKQRVSLAIYDPNAVLLPPSGHAGHKDMHFEQRGMTSQNYVLHSNKAGLCAVTGLLFVPYHRVIPVWGLCCWVGLPR